MWNYSQSTLPNWLKHGSETAQYYEHQKYFKSAMFKPSGLPLNRSLQKSSTTSATIIFTVLSVCIKQCLWNNNNVMYSPVYLGSDGWKLACAFHSCDLKQEISIKNNAVTVIVAGIINSGWFQDCLICPNLSLAHYLCKSGQFGDVVCAIRLSCRQNSTTYEAWRCIADINITTSVWFTFLSNALEACTYYKLIIIIFVMMCT